MQNRIAANNLAHYQISLCRQRALSPQRPRTCSSPMKMDRISPRVNKPEDADRSADGLLDDTPAHHPIQTTPDDSNIPPLRAGLATDGGENPGTRSCFSTKSKLLQPHPHDYPPDFTPQRDLIQSIDLKFKPASTAMTPPPLTFAHGSALYQATHHGAAAYRLAGLPHSDNPWKSNLEAWESRPGSPIPGMWRNGFPRSPPGAPAHPHRRFKPLDPELPPEPEPGLGRYQPPIPAELNEAVKDGRPCSHSQ